jgi:hypothetical protein
MAVPHLGVDVKFRNILVLPALETLLIHALIKREQVGFVQCYFAGVASG